MNPWQNVLNVCSQCPPGYLTFKALRHGSHSFACNYTSACLYQLPRKRSADGASPDWGCGHLIAAYYSFIYPERMKGWVGLVGWPTADSLPAEVFTRQLQVQCESTSPLPYPVRWNFYVCSKYLERLYSQPNFSVVSLCIIMQLCEYVFPVGFPLYVPKMVFLGGLSLEGEDVKILFSNPPKGTTLPVCWCIA